MKEVTYPRRMVLRAAYLGHITKTRDIKATKQRIKASTFKKKVYDVETLEGYRQDFRREGRILHLAYNFAKGTPYAKVERNRDNVALASLARSIHKALGGYEASVREWLGLEAQKPKTARELAQTMGRAS